MAEQQQTEGGGSDLLAQCRADYGTKEQRQERRVDAVGQRGGTQSHGNEAGGGWRGES